MNKKENIMDTIFHASEYQAVINRPHITDKPIPIYLNFTDPDDLSQLNKIVLFNDIDTLLVNPLHRVLSLFYKETVTGKVVPYYDNPNHFINWLEEHVVKTHTQEILSCEFNTPDFFTELLGFSSRRGSEIWMSYRITTHAFSENLLDKKLFRLMGYNECRHLDGNVRKFKLYKSSSQRRKETVSVEVSILMYVQDMFLANTIYDVSDLRKDYLLENQIPPFESNKETLPWT